jgi:hypothetical protein
MAKSAPKFIMQSPVNKPSESCFNKVSQMMALVLACVFLSGCAVFTSAPTDAALEAARVKLMEGAITRDQSVIQPLLAPDFTWREDNAPLDEEPYDFWNRHKLWNEFGGVLKQPLVSRDGLMIAPKDAIRSGYTGPRMAWRKVGGDWRLAYFYGSLNGSH